MPSCRHVYRQDKSPHVWRKSIAVRDIQTCVAHGIALAPADQHDRHAGTRADLSELAMFFALLGGFTVFGALGVVLGPVAFATLGAIVDTLREAAPAVASTLSTGSERAA